MDAFELLKSWPEWSRANAAKVFASPAWRMSVEYGETRAELRPAETDRTALVWMDISLDDEPYRLGIADSAAFPELHLLWQKRALLPDVLLLALVEKECGELFQTVENAVRKTFAVRGLAKDVPDDVETLDCAVYSAGKSEPTTVFALESSSAALMAFGQLRNLDTDHPSIREMRTEATACYARIECAPQAFAELKGGDYVMFPPEVKSAWRIGPDRPQGAFLTAAEKGSVSFGEIVDARLPPIPAPAELCLEEDGVVRARGTFEPLLGVPAMKVTEIL